MLGGVYEFFVTGSVKILLKRQGRGRSLAVEVRRWGTGGQSSVAAHGSRAERMPAQYVEWRLWRRLDEHTDTVDRDRLLHVGCKQSAQCLPQFRQALPGHGGCQCHVETEVFEHVRVAPAQQVCLLPRRQSIALSAPQLVLRQRSPQCVEVYDAVGGEFVQPVAARALDQCKEVGDPANLQLCGEWRPALGECSCGGQKVL